ncbi:hypothetical protein OG21DRAFT_1421449 [Imleria badia]|nr:hypothetical protein OG21DRAFT_1421449 [Imleria badia]
MITLWFCSLILSLTSVVFGMTAKHWLHEYIQWTTMSTSPADAVLFRQLRYEAFVEWGTPTIIDYISFLLQVAIALFFVGLVILLFTLNPITAGVCTILVAITLAVARRATSREV